MCIISRELDTQARDKSYSNFGRLAARIWDE